MALRRVRMRPLAPHLDRPLVEHHAADPPDVPKVSHARASGARPPGLWSWRVVECAPDMSASSCAPRRLPLVPLAASWGAGSALSGGLGFDVYIKWCDDEARLEMFRDLHGCKRLRICSTTSFFCVP